MPWDIRTTGNSYDVVKKTTGKVKHSYPKTPEGRRRARAYLRALWRATKVSEVMS